MSLELKPIDKIAILLANLPAEVSSKILSNMSEKYIKDIAVAMYNLKDINPDDCNKVLEEFYEKLSNKENKFSIEKDMVKNLLKISIGEERAEDIIKDIDNENPFEFLNTVSMKKLADIIQDENEQVIALVISNLNPDQAAEFISLLPENKRKSALKKVKKVKDMDFNTIIEVGKIIREYLLDVKIKDDKSAEKVADLISFMSKEMAEEAISVLKSEDEEFFNEVNKKLITFDKIVEYDDKLVQKIIRLVDQTTLAYALKNATQNTSDKIYKNMTAEASKAIMEDMESLVNISDKSIDEARRKFVKAMKKALMEELNNG